MRVALSSLLVRCPPLADSTYPMNSLLAQALLSSLHRFVAETTVARNPEELIDTICVLLDLTDWTTLIGPH